MLRRLAAWLERAARDDNPVTAARKAVLLAVSIGTLMTLPAVPVAYLTEDLTDPSYGLYLVWIFTMTVISAATLLLVSTGKAVTEQYYVATLAVYVTVVVMFDLHQASAMKDRAAPLFVIVFDCLLIGDVRNGVVGGFLFVVLSWMVVVQLEYITRFGLLDVWGTMSVDRRTAMMCDCDAPPCAAGVGMVVRGSVISVFVFLLDFYLTRRFSLMVKAEEGKMRAAVEVAEVVAERLSRFDLETAEAALKAEAELPPALMTSFRNLLNNLRSYRPYLPHALLSDDEDEAPPSDGSSSSATSRGSSGSIPTTGIDSRSFAADRRTPMTVTFDPAPMGRSPSLDELSVSGRHNRGRAAGPLKKVEASLLLVSCHLAAGHKLPDLAAYTETHGEYLSDILQVVKSTRGVLMHFNGDRVYASYNAFRRAVQHASNALDAANLCADACTHRADPRVAVATGPVLVGHLGNGAVVSPSILGAPAWALDQMCEVGRALGEGVVCSSGTAAHASLRYALRMLLHKFKPAVPDTRHGLLSHTAEPREPVPGALYALAPEGGKGETSVESEEWIYEMERLPGKQWEAFNDAGRRWHRDGPAAAVAWLRDQQDDAAAAAFQDGLRLARTFDFTQRVQEGGGGDREHDRDDLDVYSVNSASLLSLSMPT